MNIPLVDLKAQHESIKDEIDRAILDVTSSCSFVGGVRVDGFEEAFAAFCGVKHCVGLGNGTDALYVALKVLGIGAGDEVITVANSFIATSEAISMTGARVVFVDIDPRTYNLDVTQIEEKINQRTRAIIPVHLYGQPAKMSLILELAKRYDLRVVADAAQAHGACYVGLPISKLADIACFSFYPGKNLGAYGDAGAIVTDHDHWATEARKMGNHGRSQKYAHEFEGINSRLDAIQAAVLSVKLRYLDGWTEKRRRNAYRYNQCLEDHNVVTPQEIEDVKAVYHLYVIRVKFSLRSKLQEFLRSKGIIAGIHYPVALPYLNAYRHLNHSNGDFPEALRASQEILSLPMFPELTEEQIHYVTSCIAEFGL
jgi:dTDP-4-amino-4,6-dideoxygalactose transaminase